MNNSNIYPHQPMVDQAMRSRLKGHLPLVIWLTGLSGSGKSTIANLLEQRLITAYKAHTFLLDGDNIRSGLNADLGFSQADRKENIRRIGEVAKLMYNAGLIVISAFISPFRADREGVRTLFQHGQFWEVFISCPVEICQQRDPKGLYRRAQAGEIADFTAVSSPYEEPLAPEMIIHSGEHPPEACVDQIIERMVKEKIIQPVE